MTKKKTAAPTQFAKTYTQIFQRRSQDLSVECFVQAMQECPRATLKDVIELAGALKIGDRLSFNVTPKASSGSAAASSSRPAPKAPGKEISTRTPADRATFDEAVRMAIFMSFTDTKKWVRAEALRTTYFPGASPLQLRKACNRLIQVGKIAYQGQARGTEYKPA